MGRWAVFTAAMVAGAVLFLLWGREPLQRQLDTARVANMFVPADRDSFDPGPALGSHFPGLRAQWQGREITLLEPLAGPRGTVLVVLRSVVWSPWCREELRRLQALLPAYREAGIGLAAISRDPPQALAATARELGITLPLLSDRDHLSFATLGLLDPAHPRGSRHFGLPLPGSLVVDRDQRVVAKTFLAEHRQRVAPEAVLALAARTLPPARAPGARATALKPGPAVP
ncbi:peroxiredoxin family protein [Haliea atlantica]|nr:hypothetical protein [Haliea sp.]